MTSASATFRRAWVVPIVVAAAAVMLLPGGALLGGQARGAPVEAPASPAHAAPAVTIGGGPAFGARLDDLLSGLRSVGSNATPPRLSLDSPTYVPTVADGTGLAGGAAAAPSAALLERLQHSLADGSVPSSAAYLPSLTLLSGPPASPGDVVSPGYLASPAPMGVADYGLSTGGASSVYTPSVLGAANLTGFNASAGTTYEVTSAYVFGGENPNLARTPWQSSLQLNTVAGNVSFPTSNTGTFWAQNVVDFSGTTVQLVDNLWNLSSLGAVLESGTILAGHGTVVPGEFYYDEGPTFPLAFPLSVELYNNVTNVSGRTTVTFAAHLEEGASVVFSGTYDTVTFNSQPSAGLPLLAPSYRIDGNVGTPDALLYDAELVFGGPGAGTNAVVESLNGTLALAYGEGAGYVASPSAYDYGSDTGETAIGISCVWGPDGGGAPVEGISQGPSILYGLWNATGGVPSGSEPLSGAFSPIYGFLFLGPNYLSPYDLSWVPTAPNGTFSSVVPLSIPGASVWDATGWADGFSVGFGTLPFNTSLTGLYAALSPSSGVWDAPVYLNGLAQGQSLANDTGAYDATTHAYVFGNLTIDENLTFTHDNDFGYPEFALLWANGVTAPIVVDNVAQGPNSGSSTLYTNDRGSASDLPGLGDEFAVWGGEDDSFSHLTLVGYRFGDGVETGGAVYLWDSPDGRSFSTTALNGSFGLWVAESPSFDADALTGLGTGSVGLTLVDSSDAAISSATGTLGGAGVLDLGGVGAHAFDANATVQGIGLLAVDANDTSVRDVTAIDSIGVALLNGTGDLAVDVTARAGSTGVYGYGPRLFSPAVIGVNASTGSIGLNFTLAENTTAVYVNATGSGVTGLLETDSEGLVAVYVAATDDAHGLVDVGDTSVVPTFVNGVEASGDAVGAALDDDRAPTTIQSVDVAGSSTGVEVVGSSGATVADVVVASAPARPGSTGVLVALSELVNVAEVTAYGHDLGVVAANASALTVTDVTALNRSVAVELNGNVSGSTVAGTSAGNGSAGVLGSYVDELTVERTFAADGSVGVDLLAAEASTINGTWATDDSVGVELNLSGFTTVSATNATDGSTGVDLNGGGFLSVLTTTATDYSLAVELNGSVLTTVGGINATDDGAALELLNASEDFVFAVNVTDGLFGLLGSNVTYTTFVGLNATDTEPAAFLGNTSDLEVYYWNLSDAGPAIFENGTNLSAAFTNVTDFGLGLVLVNVTHGWINATDVSDFAIGIGVVDSSAIAIDGVNATDPYPIGPYVDAYLWGAPTAAIDLYRTNLTTVDHVTATSYPAALYDNGSANLEVQALSAEFGVVGVIANGTSYGLFSGVTTFATDVGLELNANVTRNHLTNVTTVRDADFNTVTLSAFNNSSGYGIAITGGEFNTVYDNDFVGDDGATTVYSAAHLQAFSDSPTNAFNSSGEVGNYWADWHSYNSHGVLNPYPLQNGAIDYFPLGAPEGETVVTFSETGLASGTLWSVTFDGVAESGVGASLSFDVLPGTYAFSVPGVAGYSLAPAAGTLVVGPLAVDQTVAFALENAVTFEAIGLPSGTSWTVVLNGDLVTGTASSFGFAEVNGTYSYTVVPPAGYTVSPADGTVTVAGATTVALDFTSTAAPTYAVTVEETGLASGTPWSATFNGVELTATAPAPITFTVPAGSYAYTIGAVAGFASSPSASTEVVSGPATIDVTFTSSAPPTYAVTIEESGLASGTSWGAVFDGVAASGSSPATLGFTVAAGSYAFQIDPVAGYNASITAGTVSVAGAYVIDVTFSKIVYAVTFSESGLAPGTSWSVTVNGTTHATIGASLTVDLPASAGYAWKVGNVTGYAFVTASSGSVPVSGGPAGVAVAFASTAVAPAYVPTSTYNMGVALALGLGALGVVVGLISLLRRPRTPAPATPWKEPEGPTSSGPGGPAYSSTPGGPGGPSGGR